MDRHIGPIEIKQPDGEYFYTEVYREGGKLVTGTFTNSCLLYDEWEVIVDEYGSEQEALQELYAMIEEDILVMD